jgi:5-methylcytosine-specific restriction endonuclease McrA
VSPLRKPCAGGCGALIEIGTRRCPNCARLDSARRNTRSRRDGRRTAQWQHARSLVLERDNHTCVRCGEPGNQSHSLVGGYHSDDPDDYETLCAECHGRVHGGTHHGRL